MFPIGKPRVECSKTPEQIRAEAAEATRLDLEAIVGVTGMFPNAEARLQVAAQMFWRHRDEITAIATTVHICPPEDPCDTAPKSDDKVTH